MSTINNGGPAFPGTQYAKGISPSGHSEGLSLRDYFAAKVINGILSDPNVDPTRENIQRLAQVSYEVADAMLHARGAE